MAISLQPGSVSLTVNPRPSLKVPERDGDEMVFKCTDIGFLGKCKLTGSPGDNPAGWTLGMIQLKWISTDWAHYVGRNPGDGSSFLQMARPPARIPGLCRDTVTAGQILMDNNPGHDRTVAAAGDPFPIAMSAAYTDSPSRPFPLSRTNSMTGKTNFLFEAQTEAHYYTVLTLMSPAGVFQHLKSVYWYVHWQDRFKPTNYADLHARWEIHQSGGPRSNDTRPSGVIDGGPADPRFATVATLPNAPNCNDVAGNAFDHPNIRENMDLWALYDVTQ